MIDLRSDTVTRPSDAMRERIATAEVGDDVFGDDPTVRRLEERVAGLLGKETALFFPSGTQSNQTAIKTLTSPGDEVICEAGAHLYNYEGGARGLIPASLRSYQPLHPRRHRVGKSACDPGECVIGREIARSVRTSGPGPVRHRPGPISRDSRCSLSE